jgi:hypothetical protein
MSESRALANNLWKECNVSRTVEQTQIMLIALIIRLPENKIELESLARAPSSTAGP